MNYKGFHSFLNLNLLLLLFWIVILKSKLFKNMKLYTLDGVLLRHSQCVLFLRTWMVLIGTLTIWFLYLIIALSQRQANQFAGLHALLAFAKLSCICTFCFLQNSGHIHCYFPTSHFFSAFFFSTKLKCNFNIVCWRIFIIRTWIL